MGTMIVRNNNARRHRVRLEQINLPFPEFPEPTTFGDCDFKSYSYFFLSIVLFSFGCFVTVASLAGHHNGNTTFIFSNMGHMWLIGPICICTGMMIAIKIILYLRRKGVIQMLLRQREFFTEILEIADRPPSEHTQNESIVRHPSTMTLPPSYELLMGESVSTYETPPPSYEESLLCMNQEKSASFLNYQQHAESSRTKDITGLAETSKEIVDNQENHS